MELSGCTVRVEPGEWIEHALKRFKRLRDRCDIIRDMRRHEYHIPRPERRRLKSSAARKRQGL